MKSIFQRMLSQGKRSKGGDKIAFFRYYNLPSTYYVSGVVLRALHLLTHLIFVSLREVGPIIASVLQRWKRKPRKVKKRAQRHLASKQQSRDLNLDCLVYNLHV